MLGLRPATTEACLSDSISLNLGMGAVEPICPRAVAAAALISDSLSWRPCQNGGYAARSSRACCESIPGYHFRNVARSSSFRTCVQTCNSRCAPF